MKRTQASRREIRALAALLLAGGMRMAQAQSTLGVTAAAGKKTVSVAVNPAAAGVMHCQADGGKDVATTIKATSPVDVPCEGRLTAGQAVEVWLMDGNTEKGVGHATVPKESSTSSNAGPPWDVRVTTSPDGSNILIVKILGNAPAGLTASDIALGGSTAAANPDGSFTAPGTPRVKAGDSVTITVKGIPWTGIVAAGSAPAGQAQLMFSFSPDPKETQTTIGGAITGNPDALAEVKAVYVEVLNGTDRVQGPLDAKYSPPTNTFSVTTTAALQEGQSVHVHLCGPVPTFTATTVSGMNTLSSVTVPTGVTVKAGMPVWGPGIADGTTISSVTTSGGSTAVTLSKNATAPGAGVTLNFGYVDPSAACIQETSSANNYVEIYADGASQEVTSLYDLGRMKAYFSVGAEFEANNGALGSTTGFFGLNIDENWFHTGPDQVPSCYSASDSNQYIKATKRPSDSDNPNDLRRRASSRPNGATGCGQHYSRFLINTYLEGDLTQIPLTSSSGGSGGSGGGSEGAISATTFAAAATGTTPAGSGGSGGSSSTFSISSAKGGYIEGGIYTPVIPAATQWTFRGQENALFVAPLWKYAFLVPGTAPAGATTSFNAYRSYSGGFRLGNFRMPVHFDKHAPELLSYVDFTVGKWENFREQNGSRGVRFDTSGRFKIPYTLLYVGFDVNVGPGGSDYRVFAGARVDASSILGKLLPSTN